LQQLREAALELWDELEDELLEELIESFPRRLEAVVQARGWYTKY
jgi:hypothetical protein